MSSWAKIKFWAGIAGAALVAALVAFGAAMRGARRDGVNQVLAEQQERRDELQEHYDKIDSSPPDFGGAIERLRSRSNNDR